MEREREREREREKLISDENEPAIHPRIWPTIPTSVNNKAGKKIFGIFFELIVQRLNIIVLHREDRHGIINMITIIKRDLARQAYYTYFIIAWVPGGK